MDVSVDVVIPYYKAESTISDSIESALNQSYPVKNIFVIEDGDYIPLAIRNQFDKKVIVVTLDRNFGASYARNVGVMRSTSDFIAFLDSDDYWADNKVELQIGVMEKYNADISCHNYSFFRPKEFHTDCVVKKLSLRDFILRNPCITPTVMVRRQGFELFDDRYRRCDDFRCWIENLIKPSKVFVYFNSLLAYGNKLPVGESGLTASIIKMHLSYIHVLLSLFLERDIKFLCFLMILVEYIKLPIRYVLYFYRRFCIYR